MRSSIPTAIMGTVFSDIPPENSRKNRSAVSSRLGVDVHKSFQIVFIGSGISTTNLPGSKP
jgi:hypothetical protein